MENQEREHLEIFVDDEPHRPREHTVTAADIIKLAKMNPAEHYLLRLRDREDAVSFEGKPNEPIELHNGMRFVTVHCGATPLS